MDGSVVVEKEGAVATLRLNQPQEGNVLRSPTFSLLTRHLRELAQDSSVRVLRLTAAGPDFSLGRRGSADHRDAAAFHQEFQLVQSCNEALAVFPGITVAVVQGQAVGAGCSLACRCDVVLAADDARFSFPEIPQGIAPTIVLSYFGKKLPAKPLVYMLLTGRAIDAYEAQRIGLVSEVIPAGQLEERSREFGRQVSQLDPQVTRLCKDFLTRLDRLTVDDAAQYGISLLSIAMERKVLQQEGSASPAGRPAGSPAGPTG